MIAADAAFTEYGAEASLDDIARRANVGIGTLYRHFPTRDALLAAVLNEGTAAIVARATELLDAPSPSVGLAKWLAAFGGYITMYRGLTDALAASYAETDAPLCPGCDAIATAAAALVRRAQDAGELRANVDPRDVVMAVHAAVWVGEQTKDPDAPARLLATMLAGFRADDAAPATKPRVRRAPARTRA